MITKWIVKLTQTACSHFQILLSYLNLTLPIQHVSAAMLRLSLLLAVPLTGAREISFPPVLGYTTPEQIVLGGYNDPDISQPKFAGLNTYANLPYVHCLAKEGEEVEKFDIAILGAPFDTVSYQRVGGRSRLSKYLCMFVVARERR